MLLQKCSRTAVCLAFGLAITITYAQTSGTGGSTGGAGGAGSTGGTGTTGGTTGGVGSVSRTPTVSTTPTPSTTQQPMQQPIFISGRVMLYDGTAPPEPVVIERICNGMTPKSEGYTDGRGYFGFEIGRQNSGVFQDASQGGGGMDPFSNNPVFATPTQTIGGADQRLIGCEIRAKLNGYRSQSVLLAGRRALDSPDIGTILLYPNAGYEGTLVSATINQAPKDAKKAYEKGMDLLKKKKPADAEKEFEKATAAYPRHAAAWYELGKLQIAENKEADARASFQKSIDADSKFVIPYIQVALMDAREKKWTNVVSITETAIKLDPFDYPQAHFYNAIANFNLKNMDAAEKSAREASKLDTRMQFPQNSRLLGVILAQKQDYAGAVEAFKSYLKTVPATDPDATAIREQVDAWEKANPKK